MAGRQSGHRHPRAAPDHHRRARHAGRARRGRAHLRRGRLHRHQRPADHPGFLRAIDLLCRAVRAPTDAGDRRPGEGLRQSSWPDQDIDRIWATEEVVIITVGRRGHDPHPRRGRARFSARWADSGVNVIAIAQGSSEVSISLVVAGSRCRQPALQRPAQPARSR